jgi:hypothetical protein
MPDEMVNVRYMVDDVRGLAAPPIDQGGPDRVGFEGILRNDPAVRQAKRG